MKKSDNESVLHDWINELPFTQQALLLLSLRGPDGIEKHSTAKNMLYYMRGVILKPAYEEWIGGVNAETYTGRDGFMCTDYTLFEQDSKDFFSDLDKYPMHFLMHLIHAAEVIAYQHPDEEISRHWHYFYEKSCDSFHMNIETRSQFNNRLNK